MAESATSGPLLNGKPERLQAHSLAPGTSTITWHMIIWKNNSHF